MTHIVSSQINFDINLSILNDFEADLNIRQPENSSIPAKVLGYGEISTVFAIQALPGYAFKRLSIFNNATEIEAYQTTHNEYIRHLTDADIHVIPFGLVVIEGQDGRPIVYIVQKQLESNTFAHQLLRSEANSDTVFSTVLEALSALWNFNSQQEQIQLGIDGQLSNWAIMDKQLLYVDTSTPLFRINGQEQLDPKLFLRPAPWFLRWILEWLFMDDVVGRYYDFRKVVIDAIANLYKEQLSKLIPSFIEASQPYFPNNPISEEEIRRYYDEDAFIWSLYFNLRKFDRFLTNNILRGEYRYILPGKIQR